MHPVRGHGSMDSMHTNGTPTHSSQGCLGGGAASRAISFASVLACSSVSMPTPLKSQMFIKNFCLQTFVNTFVNTLLLTDNYLISMGKSAVSTVFYTREGDTLISGLSLCLRKSLTHPTKPHGYPVFCVNTPLLTKVLTTNRQGDGKLHVFGPK